MIRQLIPTTQKFLKREIENNRVLSQKFTYSKKIYTLPVFGDDFMEKKFPVINVKLDKQAMMKDMDNLSEIPTAKINLSIETKEKPSFKTLIDPKMRNSIRRYKRYRVMKSIILILIGAGCIL